MFVCALAELVPELKTSAVPTAKRCRIAWKAVSTGHRGGGDWHYLSKEKYLCNMIDGLNTKYPGIVHWVEYK
jgi:hypothetical protein